MLETQDKFPQNFGLHFCVYCVFGTTIPAEQLKGEFSLCHFTVLECIAVNLTKVSGPVPGWCAPSLPVQVNYPHIPVPLTAKGTNNLADAGRSFAPKATLPGQVSPPALEAALHTKRIAPT
jgi:hypothetical protein